MGEEQKQGEPFRILSEDEFLALPANRRWSYLVTAGEELEHRRTNLSMLAQLHMHKRHNGD